MAIDESQIDAALENQLAAGGVVEQQVGDQRFRFAGPRELVEARELIRRQNAAAAGTQVFTITPE